MPIGEKQEETKEKEDEELPILSNDGEELVIEEEDSDLKEKEPTTNTTDVVGDETQEDTGETPKQEDEDEPIELPFVPVNKIEEIMEK